MCTVGFSWFEFNAGLDPVCIQEQCIAVMFSVTETILLKKKPKHGTFKQNWGPVMF